jgi:hypothetical protein
MIKKWYRMIDNKYDLVIIGTGVAASHAANKCGFRALENFDSDLVKKLVQRTEDLGRKLFSHIPLAHQI